MASFRSFSVACIRTMYFVVGFAVLPIVGFVSRSLLLTSGVGDGSSLLANSLPFGLQIQEPCISSIHFCYQSLVDWTWYLHIYMIYSGWVSVMVCVINVEDICVAAAGRHPHGRLKGYPKGN